MTNINLEIPEEIHKNLRLRAAKEGKTMKQVIIEDLSKTNGAK